MGHSFKSHTEKNQTPPKTQTPPQTKIRAQSRPRRKLPVAVLVTISLHFLLWASLYIVGSTLYLILTAAIPTSLLAPEAILAGVVSVYLCAKSTFAPSPDFRFGY